MLGMLGALAPGARAQVVLDQSHVITHNTKGLQALTCMDALAQTFTALRDAPAGASATLNAVEVSLVPNDTAPAADITVQIRNVDPATGAPSSGPLATALIPRTSIPLVGGFVRATFTAPATVVAGTRYAIVLSTSECRLAYGWEYDPNDF